MVVWYQTEKASGPQYEKHNRYSHISFASINYLLYTQQHPIYCPFICFYITWTFYLNVHLQRLYMYTYLYTTIPMEQTIEGLFCPEFLFILLQLELLLALQWGP